MCVCVCVGACVRVCVCSCMCRQMYHVRACACVRVYIFLSIFSVLDSSHFTIRSCNVFPVKKCINDVQRILTTLRMVKLTKYTTKGVACVCETNLCNNQSYQEITKGFNMSSHQRLSPLTTTQGAVYIIKPGMSTITDNTSSEARISETKHWFLLSLSFMAYQLNMFNFEN